MLDPREHIRRRPQLYFGGTDLKALHYLLNEVIDFAVESVFVGKSDSIEIRLKPDNFIMISDNDQVLPALLTANDFHEKTQQSLLDYWLATYRFDPSIKAMNYRVNGHHRSIGIDGINPVATYLNITVCNGYIIWKRTYRKGLPHGAYQRIQLKNVHATGVTIEFQPDFTIMDKNEFDYDRIAKRCRDIAVTLPDLTIILIDERSTQTRHDIFHYADGIQELVRELNEGKVVLHDLIYVKGIAPLKTHNGKQDIHVEVALQFTDSDDITIQSFVNSVRLEHGGTHIEGFKHALSGYLNASRFQPASWEEIAKGLTAVVNVLFPNHEFEGYPTYKLMNPEAFDAVVSILYPHLIQSNLRKMQRNWELASHFKQ